MFILFAVCLVEPMNQVTELLKQIELSSFLFVITCILLVMVFAFMVVFLIAYKRNMRIQKAMKELEDGHQQDIISSNLKVLEDERQRFARDLHDEIGAALAAIRLYVSSIDRNAYESELKSKLQEVKQTIDQSLASTRRIAYNLLPPTLEMMGLGPAIIELADSLKNSSLSIHVDVQSGLPKLDYQRELVLYRIIQELLSNTLKHSQASEVTIELWHKATQYHIQYSDNGIGFDLNRNQYKGMGLTNLKSRLDIVGGELTIQTSPDAGFLAFMVLPVVTIQ